MSLEPPRNANQAPPDVLARGRRVFDREECSVCRAPPAYTTGQLTLAQGWKPAANHPNRDDVMMPSVGTDPGTALTTRKGTGFHTIPTLRGLWYGERLLHDGSLAILEELFDPARLAPDSNSGDGIHPVDHDAPCVVTSSGHGSTPTTGRPSSRS